MKDPLLNDLLGYKNSLDETAFTLSLMDKIKAYNKRRRLIMGLFSIVGLLLSCLYLLMVLPVGFTQNIMTPTNGLLLAAIGLFLVWLWTVELASD